MFGFRDREQLRRWIAEAGMICVGAGVLWTGGCAGTARDGLAAGGATPAKSGSLVASAEKTGHASLSDRRPATAKRRPDRQTASRSRPARVNKPSGDPFLAEGPAVAQRPQRPPQSRPALAAPSSTESTAAAGSMRVAARPPVAPPTKASVAANVRSASTQSAPGQTGLARKALAESIPGSRTTQRTITQASAKMPVDARRQKPSVTMPPVITPATPAAAETESAAAPGYERQRADRLMERAHLMLSQNFREEALRLAAVAEQLEKSRLALYSPGEERPSELVARLQRAPTEGEIDASSSQDAPGPESVPRNVRRNRSQPASPLMTGVRRGHIELTDIRAGWQSAADSEEKNSTDIERTTAEKSIDQTGRTQVALLETNGTANGRPASASNLESDSTEQAPAPPDVLPETGSKNADVAADDIAEVEPVVDADSTTTRSPVNATTIGGILAGLAGLLGLTYWRRQERKHYAGATR